ncbi:hypothetical protein CCMA1212_005782 [Trichoderma ghanense]|uniref:Uncharacterized protein n=1 Tax=Trichoderma ghanense TaxID=65468 RepID=A0ABY2H345_9HYPO
MRLGSAVGRVSRGSLVTKVVFGWDGLDMGHGHSVWIEMERRHWNAHIHFILTTYIVHGYFGRHFT